MQNSARHGGFSPHGSPSLAKRPNRYGPAVFSFASAVGSGARYERYALQGIKLVSEADDMIFRLEEISCLAQAYNGVLDELAGVEGLEAAIFLHDDVEIRDPEFRSHMRAWAHEPNAGILGVVGATDVVSIAWWLGSGFGRVEESRGVIELGPRSGEVDTVDGLFIAFSPWAVQNVRFDPQVARAFHGYDVDVCFSARQRGRRVTVAEIDLFHHTRGGYGNRREFVEADMRWRAKWRPPQPMHGRVRHWARLARLLILPPSQATFDGRAR